MNYAKPSRHCEQLGLQRRDRLPCPADLLIEASGGRGYNSIALRVAIEPERVAIVNRKSTTQATIAKRSGQAMVEFAIISFVLTAMLMGFLGLIVMGLGSFQNNIATESIGRVLDQHPRLSASAFGQVFGNVAINPYTATASQVMELLTHDDPAFNAVFGAPLYHERHLVLSPSEWASRQGLPELNQKLIPSYVYDPDVIPDGEMAQGAYRYPGSVVQRTVGSETYQTVLVPLLNITGVEPCNDSDCQCESDYWVAPLRICKTLNCDCTVDPPEATNPIGSEPTFVMSLVYPSQPASMMYIEVQRDPEGRIETQTPVEAIDGDVPAKYGSQLATLPSTEYSFSDPSANPLFGASSSRGRYGLGETNAFLTKIRPYRRIFESRTAFRLRFGDTAAKYQVNREIRLRDGEQFLDFAEMVMDREPLVNRLVIPDNPPTTGPFDDYDYRALVVPATGDGKWRVSVGAEFKPDGTYLWEDGHQLELLLYVNREREQLIARETPVPGNPDAVQLIGQALIEAEAGDVIQVRVRSLGTSETILTNNPPRNWITYEFLGGR